MSFFLTERNIRLARLMSFIMFLFVFQGVYAQQTRINLHVKQVPLKQVLKSIESNSQLIPFEQIDEYSDKAAEYLLSV